MVLSQQASVAVGGQWQVAATAPLGTKRAGRASSIGFSQMDVVKKSNQKPDHRIEVARRRREAMRARILAATMNVCSANPKAVPTIDDISQIAGISRGAFYRYFSSSPEAIEEVGVELANELADAIGTLYDTLTDPLQRACVGTFLVVGRAVHDPEWAAFVLRGDLTIHNTRVMDYIRKDMRAGLEAGYFDLTNVEWAAELLMGMNLTAIRGLIERKDADKDPYRHEAVRFLLRSLGVGAKAVAEVMEWADQYLAQSGSAANWWRLPADQPTPASQETAKPVRRRKVAA